LAENRRICGDEERLIPSIETQILKQDLGDHREEVVKTTILKDQESIKVL
jgi:hypothetical protein